MNLLVDGATQSQASKHFELGQHTKSLEAPHEFGFWCACGFDARDWDDETPIILSEDDETVQFRGRIKSTPQSIRGQTSEQVAYSCVDNRAVVADVDLLYDDDAHVVYNRCDPEDEELDEDACPLTDQRSSVGEIIANILDLCKADLSGTVGTGGTGSGYSQTELDAMMNIPPRIELDESTVEDAVAQVMRFQPNFGSYLDPVAKQMRFVDMDSLTATTVTFGEDHLLSVDIEPDTTDVYTAVNIVGDYERVDTLTTLTAAWDAALQADWTSEKAHKYPDTYGKVWRFFSMGTGDVCPRRVFGTQPFFIIQYTAMSWSDRSWVQVPGHIDFDAGTVKLHMYARDHLWTGGASTYTVPPVLGRFTYRAARVAVRYPTAGYTGSAYDDYGIERLKTLRDTERLKHTLQGVIDEIDGASTIHSYQLGAKKDKLIGKTILITHADTSTFSTTLSDNSRAVLTLSVADNTMSAGDTFEIAVEDDSEDKYESDTISAMGIYGREWLNACCDVQYQGSVVLSGVDYAYDLGISLNLAGTNNASWGTAAIPVRKIIYDHANQTTALSVDREPLGEALSYEDLMRQYLARQTLEEHRTRIRQVFRRVDDGNKNEEDDDKEEGPPPGSDHGMLVFGDDTWTEHDDTGAVWRIVHTMIPDPGVAGTEGANGVGEGTSVLAYIAKDAMRHMLTGYIRELAPGNDWIEITGGGGTQSITFSHADAQSATSTFGGGSREIIVEAAIDDKGHIVSASVDTRTIRGNDDWIDITDDGTNIDVVHDTAQAITVTEGGADEYVQYAGLDAKGHVGELTGGAFTDLAGDGIEYASSSFGVDLASEPGLEFTAGQLRVKVNAAWGMARDASGIYVTLLANGALTFDATGGAIEWTYDDTLQVDAAGLAGVVAGGGLITGGSGVEHDTAQAITVTEGGADEYVQYAGLDAKGHVGELTGGAFSDLAGDGIEYASSLFGVDLASEPGLEFTAGQLRVKVNAAWGMARDASGIYVTLLANGALTFDATGGAIEWTYDDTLQVDAAGLAGVVAGGGLITGGSGIEHYTPAIIDSTYTVTGGSQIEVDVYGHVVNVVEP